jgi:predicted anti-sigma-YlaC factor YlaD
MEKFCEDIKQMLVDYADGQLSPSDSCNVAEHLAKCEKCQKLLEALHKTLDLTGVIWADSLSETENIRIPTTNTRKVRWLRYAAIAASIFLLATVSIVWHTLTRPIANELTYAEIERKIMDEGTAAKLLATTDLFSSMPNAERLVKKQYEYIVDHYPNTKAAATAKTRIQ